MPASARPARLATSVAFGVQGMVFAALLTRLPALKDKLDFTDGQLTVLLAVVPVIAGLGSVLADLLAARRGSAPVLRGALLCVCLAAAAVALSPTRPLIYLALAGYGLAVGAVDATMNMQGVAVQARYGRSIMNGFHAVYSLAAITGALYTAVVADFLSVEASTGLVAAVGVLAIASAGRWLAVAGPAAVAARVGGAAVGGAAPVAGGVAVGGAAPVGGDAAPVGAAAVGGAAVGAAAVGGAVPVTPAGVVVPVTPDGAAPAAVPWRLLLPIGVAIGCVYVADSGVSNWSAVYLHDTLLSTEGVAALAYAAYQAAALLGRLFGDRLVGRYGAVPVVRAAVVVAALGLLVVIAAGSPSMAIGGFAVAGLGASVLVPLSFSAAGRLDGGRGTAVARVNLFNYTGYLVGAPLVGAVGSLTDPRLGWLAPLLLLGAVLAMARRLDPAPAVA